MPYGLVRFQESRQSHFVTFSCYRRLPNLRDAATCEIFLESFERVRRKYRFRVYAYVLMPEHVHLLVSEPEIGTLATALQALKISVARQMMRKRADSRLPFWQKRYYDHNVRSARSFTHKLCYIHRNPVTRGLVEWPEDWEWSSFRHYLTAEIGPVEIESRWTADRKEGRDPAPFKVRRD